MIWQSLMSSISLICFTCPIIFLKETRTSIYWRVLMLHQDTRFPGPLESKNQVKLYLYWKQSIKRVACSNILRYFNVIMGLSLKMKWQNYLKNTTLILEEQQQNTSIPIRSLWKPLTKSCKWFIDIKAVIYWYKNNEGIDPPFWIFKQPLNRYLKP